MLSKKYSNVRQSVFPVFLSEIFPKNPFSEKWHFPLKSDIHML